MKILLIAVSVALSVAACSSKNPEGIAGWCEDVPAACQSGGSDSSGEGTGSE